MAFGKALFVVKCMLHIDFKSHHKKALTKINVYYYSCNLHAENGEALGISIPVTEHPFLLI